MNITSWLQYDFMRNALIAVLIITPLFGIMGTMIVNKKMAYFSDALGHSALTGIAVGVRHGRHLACHGDICDSVCTSFK